MTSHISIQMFRIKRFILVAMLIVESHLSHVETLYNYNIYLLMKKLFTCYENYYFSSKVAEKSLRTTVFLSILFEDKDLESGND
jgi:hypothetical protein